MVNHNKNNQSLKTWIAMHSLNARNDERAFTIVELLVVIIVIAVLAAITIVGYRGISKQATESVMKGDLSNSFKALENFKTLNDTYPSTIDCSKSESSTNLCLENNSKDITFTYVPSSDLKTYQLCTTSANLKENYCISNSNNIPTVAADADLPSNVKTCPSGFILVPGSTTYGTSDFCVMKYLAKADADGDGVGDTSENTGVNTWPANSYPISSSIKLTSTPGGYAVANISQTTAMTAASNYTENCPSGCHLITEAEWMTIAQNVLQVPANWSTGTVGYGYIYSGNNDGSAAVLQASTDDNDGYYGTGNASGNQKRTLVLSNGEVIWDLAGNMLEWTSGQTTGNQPGVSSNTSFAWHEWNTVVQNGFSYLSMPVSTGISNISSLTTSNGIGDVFCNYSDVTTRGFLRAGLYANYSDAGVLFLQLNQQPSFTNAATGFRVVSSTK